MILDVLDMLSNSKNVSATVKFPRHILSNVVLLVEFKNQEEVVVRVCALVSNRSFLALSHTSSTLTQKDTLPDGRQLPSH